MRILILKTLLIVSIYSAELPDIKSINEKYWNLAEAEITCTVKVQPTDEPRLDTYEAIVKFGRGKFSFIGTNDPPNIFRNLFNMLTPGLLSEIIPTKLAADTVLTKDKNAIVIDYRSKKNPTTIRYNFSSQGTISEISESRAKTPYVATMKLLWSPVKGKHRLRRLEFFKKETDDMTLDETIDIEYAEISDPYVPKQIKMSVKMPIISYSETIDFTKCSR